MTQYISKDDLVAEIKNYISAYRELLAKTDRNDTVWVDFVSQVEAKVNVLQHLLTFIDTLETKDPYEQCVQYSSVKDGIKAHAETYSFNIESQLFNQLTKEQQSLWRKEIEQAVISGGDAGVELARDARYKENGHN